MKRRDGRSSTDDRRPSTALSPRPPEPAARRGRQLAHFLPLDLRRRKQDPFGVNTYLAAAIRASLRREGLPTPVVTSGKIREFAQAEAILRAGDADAVGMARALLADPDLPRKWLAGADRDARACVFCPYCEEEDQHHRESERDHEESEGRRHPQRAVAAPVRARFNGAGRRGGDS